MGVRPKSIIKSKLKVKSQSAIKPKKNRQSKQNFFAHLSEDIISNVGVGIYIVQQGKFVYVSPLFQKLTGYSKTDLIGQDSLHHIHPDDRDRVKEKAIESLKGKSKNSYEFRFIGKNKEIIWVLEMLTSITYEGKRAALGSFMDITERKRVDNSLLQSEDKYRTILEEMNDSYYELDLAGNFTFVNDALSRTLGYSKKELIGMNFRAQAVKEDIQRLFDTFSNIYRTGKPERNIYYKGIRKDGTIGFAELAGFTLQNQKGEVIGFRGINRDITERKLMEEALRQSEEKYRTILEDMNDSYYELDLAGNFTFVNVAVARSLGYSKDELIGMSYRDQAVKEDHKLLFDAYNKIYRTGKPERDIPYRFIRKDGTIRFAEITGFPLQNQKGEIIGFRGLAMDVTERKLVEEALRQSEERYRTVIEEMEEWYFETDLSGNIIFFNDAITRASGYSPKEVKGLSFRSFFNQKEADALYKTFRQVYETGEPVKNFPIEFIKPDSSSISAEISILPKRDREGKIYEFRGVGHDITARKRAEERIQYLATHDALTGLPNRMMFSQMLNHSIQSAKRYKRQFAIFFIDLDRFKIINDTLGYEAGDQLLQEMSTRFEQVLRASDILARLGGDEFVILIEEIDDLSYVETVAQRILSTAIKPMTIMGQECHITASIGISTYPKDGEDEQSLMKQADIAMYFAKEEGKNNFQFYSKDIKTHSVERLSIETQLRFALERNELSLHYQAKLDFKTDAITGVEALLRWHNPQLGEVTPTQIIPVAEETGLIIPIGRWVMKTACTQNVAWQRQGLPPMYMAVNLSRRQFMDNDLVEDVKTALKESGMAPDLLELEITESMVMYNPARMVAILTEIKNLGVRLAIDDFGTGYSFLGQIKHFPVDTLKIDRSFIRNVSRDLEDKAITEAIIAMGKTLSLTVVAEGVETKEQMSFLQQLLCDEMQGFYFSKPVEPDKFADLLRKHLPHSKS